MEAIITSASNSTIKQLRKLMKSAQARREENRYVAEGIHLVKSYLEAGKVPSACIVAASALKNQEASSLAEQTNAAGAKQYIVADSLFESVTKIHASVGICILFEPEVPTRNRLPLSRSAVLLEGIQDPGNLGTVLRTAAAVGVKDVLLSADCTSPWSPKALRAGMGAQFSLAIYEDMSLLECAETSRIPTLATTLASDNTPLYDIDLSEPVAWIFGNEGQGISAELASSATKRILIPQVDSAVESLNVAAAAAVCLYEQYRQNIAQ